MTAQAGLEGLLFHQIDFYAHEIAEIVLQRYELAIQPSLKIPIAVVNIPFATWCPSHGWL